MKLLVRLFSGVEEGDVFAFHPIDWIDTGEGGGLEKRRVYFDPRVLKNDTVDRGLNPSL